jgi:hypothetical protein
VTQVFSGAFFAQLSQTGAEIVSFVFFEGEDDDVGAAGSVNVVVAVVNVVLCAEVAGRERGGDVKGAAWVGDNDDGEAD